MPTPTYTAPINQPTGALLSAGLTNYWINDVGLLWGAAARTYDMFTGFNLSSDHGIYNTEQIVWAGHFRYAGIKNLICNLIRTGETMRVYVGDDVTPANLTTITSGNKVIDTGITASWTSIDLSAYTFTSGSQYLVKVNLIRLAAGTVGGRLDYMAIETSNGYSYPTLVALADLDVPTSANLSTITTGLNFLNDIAKSPTGSFASINFTGSGLNTVFANGGWFHHGLASASAQIAVTLTYRFQSGTAVFRTRTADGANTLIDSRTLTSNGVENTDSFNLPTPLSYSVNTFYHWTVESDTSDNDPTRNYVRFLSIGGNIGMTNTVGNVAQGDEVRGSTGTNPLAKMGGSASTSNLNEIRTQLKGSAALPGSASASNGFQFLAPAHIGTKYWDGPSRAWSIASPTIAADGSALDGSGVRFKRPHVWRYLYYVTTTGTSGSLVYGNSKSVSLPDTVGAWLYYDLDSILDLAPGMLYQVSGVLGAFESQS